MEEVSSSKHPDQPWRVLEFYSGIGAMRYSIMKAGVNAQMVEAFDINDTANDVYEHNFGHRPYQGNIQTLSAADLDRYRANVWLLSPPCQPYTRQGLQKGSADARASSFLKILELIPQISLPPLMIFVENVVGFETSDTHRIMVDILARAAFVTQEFILSPLQFGVPYSRPRYFCLAKRVPSCFKNPLFNNRLLSDPSLLLGQEPHDTRNTDNQFNKSQENCNDLLQACDPIENYLELKDPQNHADIKSDVLQMTAISESSFGTDDPDEADIHSISKYLVPLKEIERWGNAMDIVYPDSKRCCCFTKSYYRYVKGTGSLLATIKDLQVKTKNETFSLEKQRLRYFTPREVANLHSFPKEFSFPQHISLRQRYALLGNSMSVAVVAPLLEYLFAEPS